MTPQVPKIVESDTGRLDDIYIFLRKNWVLLFQIMSGIARVLSFMSYFLDCVLWHNGRHLFPAASFMCSFLFDTF